MFDKVAVSRIADELKGYSLFRGVDKTDLEHLVGVMKPQTYAPTEILFQKDAPGDFMMVVRTGRIRIFIVDEMKNEFTFRHFGAGDLVGELTLLDEKPRSANAQAVETTEVLILERPAFLDFLRERPLLGISLLKTLSERIRYTTTYLEKMRDATEMLSNNDFELAQETMSGDHNSEDIGVIVQAFLEMARSVRARDMGLRKVGARAKVEIDRADS